MRPEEGWDVGDVSRRSFLTKGAVSAAGAVAVINAGPAALANIASSAGAAELSADDQAALKALEAPMMVHVRDASTGEIEVLVGERSIVLEDKALVAKLLRASA
jgi:hypothetical protein